jgi:hypothetical protein
MKNHRQLSLYYPGCGDAIQDPQCSDCPTKELGDIRSTFLVKKGFAFTDITSTAEWTSGIESGDIYVFPFTRGTLEAAENMVEGFGDNEDELDSFTYTLNVIDPNYKGNYAFWNSIKGNKRWRPGYRTETQVHLFDKTGTIIPKAPVGEGKKTAVRWNVMIKVTQDEIPEPFDMPEGVFDRCIDLA